MPIPKCLKIRNRCWQTYRGRCK